MALPKELLEVLPKLTPAERAKVFAEMDEGMLSELEGMGDGDQDLGGGFTLNKPPDPYGGASAHMPEREQGFKIRSPVGEVEMPTASDLKAFAWGVGESTVIGAGRALGAAGQAVAEHGSPAVALQEALLDAHGGLQQEATDPTRSWPERAIKGVAYGIPGAGPLAVRAVEGLSNSAGKVAFGEGTERWGGAGELAGAAADVGLGKIVKAVKGARAARAATPPPPPPAGPPPGPPGTPSLGGHGSLGRAVATYLGGKAAQAAGTSIGGPVVGGALGAASRWLLRHGGDPTRPPRPPVGSSGGVVALNSKAASEVRLISHRKKAWDPTSYDTPEEAAAVEAGLREYGYTDEQLGKMADEAEAVRVEQEAEAAAKLALTAEGGNPVKTKGAGGFPDRPRARAGNAPDELDLGDILPLPDAPPSVNRQVRPASGLGVDETAWDIDQLNWSAEPRPPVVVGERGRPRTGLGVDETAFDIDQMNWSTERPRDLPPTVEGRGARQRGALREYNLDSLEEVELPPDPSPNPMTRLALRDARAAGQPPVPPVTPDAPPVIDVPEGGFTVPEPDDLPPPPMPPAPAALPQGDLPPVSPEVPGMLPEPAQAPLVPPQGEPAAPWAMTPSEDGYGKQPTFGAKGPIDIEETLTDLGYTSKEISGLVTRGEAAQVARAGVPIREADKWSRSRLPTAPPGPPPAPTEGFGNMGEKPDWSPDPEPTPPPDINPTTAEPWWMMQDRPPDKPQLPRAQSWSTDAQREAIKAERARLTAEYGVQTKRWQEKHSPTPPLRGKDYVPPAAPAAPEKPARPVSPATAQKAVEAATGQKPKDRFLSQRPPARNPPNVESEAKTFLRGQPEINSADVAGWTTDQMWDKVYEVWDQHYSKKR